MGVFKWLRRERVTVTSRVSPTPSSEGPPSQVGTIRTAEYKRDLAEFQARRSSGAKELLETPKKKCGRHSLPVSCTDCTGDPDTTFNYEKKSAIKYKKKSHKRTRSANSETCNGVPNVQFLFQNQVFMPGNMYGASFSEPRRKSHRQTSKRSPDFTQKQIDFDEDQEQPPSPPFFFKDNQLPFDSKAFLDGGRTDDDEIDGNKSGGPKTSSPSSGPSQRNDSCEEKLWEVMSELKHFDQWADEQLQVPSVNTSTSKSDDSKSDTSAFGLPVASACNLNVTIDKSKAWSHGKWGVVPVQIKKLAGVTIESAKKKRNMEINILRKCRHPNIILLMGLYPDVQNNIHIICERCIDTLFGLLHVQGRIVSAQTSVHYALDIANALVFLRMQGYLHTELSSMSIMITTQDTAKLADLGPCVKLPLNKKKEKKNYELYSPEPQYVNLAEIRESTSESEPLLSQRSMEAYLNSNAVGKHYKAYSESEHYRWQAPELFEPDESGLVHPCSRSDVYSLCVVLWECCNAILPWKTQSYDKLKEMYALWKTGIKLPQDGTYPGSLLSLLQKGLALGRNDRMDLNELQTTLLDVKRNLDNIEYIIIPARLSKKQSSFSTQGWETTSGTDSDLFTPKNLQHKVVIHTRDSSTESDKESKSNSPLYETIRKTHLLTSFTTEKCVISDEEDNAKNESSRDVQDRVISAYSTPMTNLEIQTPGTLYKSDSTEYCSILSPDTRFSKFGLTDESIKDQSAEKPTAKLSRSFTPKSYKPLHIKVPEFNNLESIKNILKEKSDKGGSSYTFDIKNYSLPSTPIARSNKLRKNAWLSGDFNTNGNVGSRVESSSVEPNTEDTDTKQSETIESSTCPSIEKTDTSYSDAVSTNQTEVNEVSVESDETVRDNYTGLRRISDPPDDFTTLDQPLERSQSLNCMKSIGAIKSIEDDVLASVNVKPLVAIHERWIYEANKKTERSLSCPENTGVAISRVKAVKPASHCVDTMQMSLPSLSAMNALPRRVPPPRSYRSVAPVNVKNGGNWEQYSQAREAISRSMNSHIQDATWRKASEKGTNTSLTEDLFIKEDKIDRSTDTMSIDEFIKDLVRKEIQQLIGETSHISDSTNSLQKSDDILNKGVANVVKSLNNGEESKKDVKYFSSVKINGNNQPLLHIKFSRSGENTLQVLDNCVNVTISDGSSGKEKLNVSMEDTLTEDVQVNALKRCQAFSAIQEARSTEDLYIDDDLSTMQGNFGGKVKLIPLHGSLHEILCDKEDDCCLIKVKQENGCDTIYFRCDNSDTESRDAIDGTDGPTDTVVYKRSISLIEERIQRVAPKEKRPNPVAALKKLNEKLKARPKSEIFVKNITNETRFLSNSSPSLYSKDRSDEVEVNIENVMSYQDSSSDECLRCQVDDDFEILEREIEDDMKNSNTLACGCLEKISEENLSTINEDSDKN